VKDRRQIEACAPSGKIVADIITGESVTY